MSSRKIYLFDNGFASAIHYSFSGDRGKLLENLVFSRLRTVSEEIYFLKNGYECDFAVFPRGERPLLVQVTDRLHQDNLSREIKGLQNAKKIITNGRGLLLTGESTGSTDETPEWIEQKKVSDWLLEPESRE